MNLNLMYQLSESHPSNQYLTTCRQNNQLICYLFLSIIGCCLMEHSGSEPEYFIQMPKRKKGSKWGTSTRIRDSSSSCVTLATVMNLPEMQIPP